MLLVTPSAAVKLLRWIFRSLCYLNQCHMMEAAELEKQIDKLEMKVPSRIDVLNAHDSQQLGIDEVRVLFQITSSTRKLIIGRS